MYICKVYFYNKTLFIKLKVVITYTDSIIMTAQAWELAVDYLYLIFSYN